ncbi:MAG TPA: DUF1972 domain-containing protein [Phnomibacter sp.]|nr:DUF1972 domain-containing protein [Phnomibacter sp.]
MHIAILGTRGIPNYYGGFEQFAEYLSVGLVQLGYEVTVYNSHAHPYQGNEWNGVKIVHCQDPEGWLGTAGQFVYDLNCIRDTRKKNFDIILQLGYTSSSVWGWLLPRRKSIVTTNMDGLEWKRTKYSSRVQAFLRYAEKLGVKYSDFLISDSIGIQKYLWDKYQKSSIYIPYGANLFSSPDENCLTTFNVTQGNFDMLVARLEPENSIEEILDGVSAASEKKDFLVVGKHETAYGAFLKEKYKYADHIRFVGGIYDIRLLNNLRHYSNIYFHGHTVGGTNPSLLEAMASQALIAAHNNLFNKSILGEDALYFENSRDVKYLLDNKGNHESALFISNNEKKITDIYSWPSIVEQYLIHFNSIQRVKF